jgi:predicted nucleic acid-binding protein
MTGKTFIDTNLLVCSVDRHDAARRRRARARLEELREGRGVLSTQVLQEFFVVAVTKLGIDAAVARELVNHWARFETVAVDVDLIRAAIDCSVLYRLSLREGLIVAAAEKSHCVRLWTEDMDDGQVIRGVRVENPLRGAEGRTS